MRIRRLLYALPLTALIGCQRPFTTEYKITTEDLQRRLVTNYQPPKRQTLSQEQINRIIEKELLSSHSFYYGQPIDWAFHTYNKENVNPFKAIALGVDATITDVSDKGSTADNVRNAVKSFAEWAEGLFNIRVKGWDFKGKAGSNHVGFQATFEF